MQLLIKTDGNVLSYCIYKGLYHSKPQQYIHIYYSLADQNPGLPFLEQDQKPMLIDNSTLLPVVDAEGNPVMITVSKPTGEYWQVNDPELGTYTDYNQPIFEDIEEQKTIGEYDAVMWWFWSLENTTPHSSIEAMILEGMKRRMGMTQVPYTFTQTPEWLATITA